MSTEITVSDFRTRFAEYAELSDAQIQVVLDDASQVFFDEAMWDARDFKLAVLYWCAHYLALWGEQAAMSGFGASSTMDVFVRSVRIGERSVVFQARQAARVQEQTAGPGEALLGQTVYGQMFLQLRTRNFPGVLVV